MNIEEYTHEAILDELTPEEKDTVLEFVHGDNKGHALHENMSNKMYTAIFQLLVTKIDYEKKKIQRRMLCR